MQLYFTICSNNYLAQASVLGKSIKTHEPTAKFFIFLCDHKSAQINYSIIADEVIEASAIEPLIDELAVKYNIVELNTCIKPRAFEYLFNERKITSAVFLDPDICVYNALNLHDQLNNCNILLTPHVYSPIPLDGKTPTEAMFQNFGIYNLGFIGVSNTEESNRFLQWWKERTYETGSIDVYNGIFVDQLPINHVPVFFKGVNITDDIGMNMAPWNLHERYLTEKDGMYYINKITPLKFYHFSNFNISSPELPQHLYNRFTLDSRPDLLPLYAAYKELLLQNNYEKFSPMKPYYTQDKPGFTNRVLRKLFS